MAGALAGIEAGSLHPAGPGCRVGVGWQRSLERPVLVAELDGAAPGVGAVVEALAWWPTVRDPRLVDVVSAARTGSRLTVALDMADATPLERLATPTRAEAVHIVCEVLHGLDVLHGAGRVHGEIDRRSVGVEIHGGVRVAPPGLAQLALGGARRVPTDRPGDDILAAGSLLAALLERSVTRPGRDLLGDVIAIACAPGTAERFRTAMAMRVALQRAATEELGDSWSSAATGLSSIAAGVASGVYVSAGGTVAAGGAVAAAGAPVLTSTAVVAGSSLFVKVATAVVAASLAVGGGVTAYKVAGPETAAPPVASGTTTTIALPVATFGPESGTDPSPSADPAPSTSVVTAPTLGPLTGTPAVDLTPPDGRPWMYRDAQQVPVGYVADIEQLVRTVSWQPCGFDAEANVIENPVRGERLWYDFVVPLRRGTADGSAPAADLWLALVSCTAGVRNFSATLGVIRRTDTPSAPVCTADLPGYFGFAESGSTADVLQLGGYIGVVPPAADRDALPVTPAAVALRPDGSAPMVTPEGSPTAAVSAWADSCAPALLTAGEALAPIVADAARIVADSWAVEQEFAGAALGSTEDQLANERGRAVIERLLELPNHVPAGVHPDVTTAVIRVIEAIVDEGAWALGVSSGDGVGYWSNPPPLEQRRKLGVSLDQALSALEVATRSHALISIDPSLRARLEHRSRLSFIAQNREFWFGSADLRPISGQARILGSLPTDYRSCSLAIDDGPIPDLIVPGRPLCGVFNLGDPASFETLLVQRIGNGGAPSPICPFEMTGDVVRQQCAS